MFVYHNIYPPPLGVEAWYPHATCSECAQLRTLEPGKDFSTESISVDIHTTPAIYTFPTPTTPPHATAGQLNGIDIKFNVSWF